MVIVKRIRVHPISMLGRLSRGAALVVALATLLAITTLSPVSASARTQAHPARPAGNSAPAHGAGQTALYPIEGTQPLTSQGSCTAPRRELSRSARKGRKSVACTEPAALADRLPASATSRSAPGAPIVRVSTPSALPPGVRPTFKLPPCIPKINSFDRTHECWLESITFPFFKGKTLIGTNEVFIFQYIILVSNSAKWSEEDEVVATIRKGQTAPITAHLSASCGAHCTAHAHFNGILNVGLKGSVSYSVSVGKNAKIETPTHYALVYDAPPFIPANVARWNSRWQYRCDIGMFTARDKCVRGHIPLKLNVDLGQKAYQGLINSDRLIDEDPFLVTVTS